LRPGPGSEAWPDPLDGVRVVQTRIHAGETTPLHTHILPNVSYVLSGSHFVRRNGAGDVLVDTRTDDPAFALPSVQWSEGIDEHTLENPGPEDLLVIGVELKDYSDPQGARVDAR